MTQILHRLLTLVLGQQALLLCSCYDELIAVHGAGKDRGKGPGTVILDAGVFTAGLDFRVILCLIQDKVHQARKNTRLKGR
jgi:hypothetical protein